MSLRIAASALLVISACGSKAETKVRKPRPVQPPRVQMKDLVRAVCNCTSPKCLKTTRLAVLKLDATPEVRAQLGDMSTCENKANAIVLTAGLRRSVELATELCACTAKTCRDAVRAKLMTLRDSRRSWGGYNDTAEQQNLSNSYDAKIAKCAAGDVDLDPGAVEALAMEKFMTRMCACADAACTKTVDAERKSWVDKTFRGGKRKGSTRNVKRWNRAQARYATCYRNNLTLASQLDRMKKLTDEMCKCKARACATEVHKRYVVWSKKVPKRSKLRSTKQSVSPWNAVQKRYTQCYVAAGKKP